MALGDTETQAHAIRRSRSSMEIQRFAEPEGEDDYSDIFGSEGGTDEAGSETSGDDHSLLLNTKLSNNSWVRPYIIFGLFLTDFHLFLAGRRGTR